MPESGALQFAAAGFDKSKYLKPPESKTKRRIPVRKSASTMSVNKKIGDTLGKTLFQGQQNQLDDAFKKAKPFGLLRSLRESTLRKLTQTRL